MSLNAFQARAAAWAAARFPHDSLELRGLALAEETGELVRCIAKMATGQRGTREEWMQEMWQEVGDVFLALQHLCNHVGFDLDEAVNERWDQVADRDVYARRLPSEPIAVFVDLPSGA